MMQCVVIVVVVLLLVASVLASKKSDICNRRQITPQGFYLHYGIN